ncbi:hypothetical protein N8664_02690 [Verrucomicrobia bacterium]|nr:hypothetical protein [Verrucomicrobiota bacterium]MDB4705736.1 hypothetical protein [Verrucomicrobiota bacterium]
MKRIKKFFISLTIMATGIWVMYLSLVYRLPWLDRFFTAFDGRRYGPRKVYDPSDPSITLVLSGGIISAFGLLWMVDTLRNKQPKLLIDKKEEPHNDKNTQESRM